MMQPPTPINDALNSCYGATSRQVLASIPNGREFLPQPFLDLEDLDPVEQIEGLIQLVNVNSQDQLALNRMEDPVVVLEGIL